MRAKRNWKPFARAAALGLVGLVSSCDGPSGTSVESRTADLSAAKLTASLPMMCFGGLVPGASRTMNVILSNSGAQELTWTAFGLPAPATPFTVSNLPNLGATLAPGASITLPVLFAPTAHDSYSGSLVVSSSGGSVTVAMAGWAADGNVDSRFGTYEQVPTDRAPVALPFRVGQTGFVCGAEFITVGKLDGSQVGPFAGKEADEIAKRWMLLRTRKPVPNYNRWISWLSWFDRWGEVYSVQGYETAMSAIIGDKKTPYYMKDVLEAQLRAEGPLLPDMIRSQLAWLDQKYALIKMPADATYPVVFEVANEPNAYPFIPPKLYAWYFLKWRQQVASAMSTVNAERKKSGQRQGSARIMPGGLWTWEGVPSGLTSFINAGVSAEVAGITLRSKIMTSTAGYYQAFLDAMKNPLFCDEKTEPQLNNGSVVRLCGDSLGNVNITSWTYRNLNGVVVNPPLGAKTYYAVPAAWTPVPAAQLVELGNLHFYPYLAAYSSMNLDAQWSNLRALVDLVQKNTSSHRVWLTELGNFNPWPVNKVVTDMMAPVLSRLAASDIPAIERWFWYLGRGSDPKFDMLKSVPSGLDLVGKELVYALWSNVVRLIPGFRLPDLPNPDQQTEILSFLRALKARRPPQGLYDDAAGVQSAGHLTQLGRYYLQQAVRAPLALPPAPEPAVVFNTTTGEVFSTDESGNAATVSRIAGGAPSAIAAADRRIGLLGNDGSVAVALQPPNMASPAVVWTPGARATRIGLNASWNRVGLILADGSFVVGEGDLADGFAAQSGNVSSFALGDERFVLLRNDGSAYLKYGGLDGSLHALATDVRAVATAGSRTVVLTTSNTLLGTEDRMGSGLMTLAQGVKSVSLTPSRIAIIGQDGSLKVADGPLSTNATWVPQLVCQAGQGGPRVFCPVDSVALAGKRIAATMSGRLVIKDDNIDPGYSWQIATDGVTAFDISGDRLAAIVGGELGVRDGWVDNWGEWAILGEGVSSFGLAKSE